MNVTYYADWSSVPQHRESIKGDLEAATAHARKVTEENQVYGTAVISTRLGEVLRFVYRGGPTRDAMPLP